MLGSAPLQPGRGTIQHRILHLIAVIGAVVLHVATVPRAQAQETDLLITNVRILHLDEAEPRMEPDRSVLISEGRIVRIAPNGTLRAAPGARTIDGEGRIALPGLVDMHVHVWDQAALGAYLASGVTTIRNASGMPFHLRLARRIAAGELAGPRLLTTGPILNSAGPNAQLNHQIVETEAQAREAVRAQHAAGYDTLKVYSNLSRDAWRGIREEAALLDMKIMGHSPEGRREPGMPDERPFHISFESLLEADFVVFEHVETIVWHGLRNRHDEAAARLLARRIAMAGVPVDPTLVAFRNLLHVAETKGGYLRRDGTDMLNPLLVAQEQENYARWTAEAIEPNREAFEFYKQATRIFADAGVLIVAGSDAGIFTNVPGVSLIDELALLEEAGLTRFQVLRAATRNAAIALGEAETHGCVRRGCAADLLLLDADPLTDLRAAGDPAMVVAGGRAYDRQALEALKEAARTPDLERTVRNVKEGLEAQGTDTAGLFES